MATGASATRLSLAYQYDPAGNVSTITDATRPEVTSYTYDSLNRLTALISAQSGTTVLQQNYAYDILGDIAALSQWPQPYFSLAGTGAVGSGA